MKYVSNHSRVYFNTKWRTEIFFRPRCRGLVRTFGVIQSRDSINDVRVTDNNNVAKQATLRHMQAVWSMRTLFVSTAQTYSFTNGCRRPPWLSVNHDRSTEQQRDGCRGNKPNRPNDKSKRVNNVVVDESLVYVAPGGTVAKSIFGEPINTISLLRGRIACTHTL